MLEKLIKEYAIIHAKSLNLKKEINEKINEDLKPLIEKKDFQACYEYLNKIKFVFDTGGIFNKIQVKEFEHEFEFKPAY